MYGDWSTSRSCRWSGCPVTRGHETVAALIVPDYEQEATARRVREAVREHVKDVGKSLPLYKRLKVFHLWDHDLPKTSTRKVKRRDMIKELQRLERAAKGGAEARSAMRHSAHGRRVATRRARRRSQKKRGTITSTTGSPISASIR